MAETTSIHEVAKIRSPLIYFVAAVVASVTLFVHVQSYYWSEEVTLCDATICADEGLISLLVPLTRISPGREPQTAVKLYKRGANCWDFLDSSDAGKCTLRNWMGMLDKVRCPGGMIADFGYWQGFWGNASRQGPLVVVFVPVWFVGVIAYGIFLLFYFQVVRLRLSFLFALIAVWAVILYCSKLRADH